MLNLCSIPGLLEQILSPLHRLVGCIALTCEGWLSIKIENRSTVRENNNILEVPKVGVEPSI